MRFYVNVPQPSVEKPEQLQNQAALGYGEFDAVAGLSDDLQKQYDDAVKHGGKDFTANRKAVTDCAKQLGFPVPYFDTDVAADLDKFRVQWTLHADPGDAVYEFQKTQWVAPGSRIGKLTRAAPDLAAHIFYAKVQPQQPWSYAPQLFEQRSHEASATAELQTDQALGASTPVFTLIAATPQTYQFTLATGRDYMTVTYDDCTGGRTPPRPVTLPIGIPLVKTGAPIARPSPTGPITYSTDFVDGYSAFHYSWSITGV